MRRLIYMVVTAVSATKSPNVMNCSSLDGRFSRLACFSVIIASVHSELSSSFHSSRSTSLGTESYLSELLWNERRSKRLIHRADIIELQPVRSINHLGTDVIEAERYCNKLQRMNERQAGPENATDQGSKSNVRVYGILQVECRLAHSLRDPTSIFQGLKPPGQYSPRGNTPTPGRTATSATTDGSKFRRGRYLSI